MEIAFLINDERQVSSAVADQAIKACSNSKRITHRRHGTPELPPLIITPPTRKTRVYKSQASLPGSSPTPRKASWDLTNSKLRDFLGMVTVVDQCPVLVLCEVQAEPVVEVSGDYSLEMDGA